MPANWKLKPEIPDNISGALANFPKLFLQLLFNRGLTEEAEINKFLDCKYGDLHDPFLFKDMKKAVERIWKAIGGNQKICIYGDYDADAVTANAVLRQTFSYLGVDVTSYIPDRFTEGYGINIEALEKIRDGGAKVIITVDCGTNSVDAADFCAQNGIDLIITDHHELIGDMPKAYALINPKNPDDNYPYSEITGVGVAFKLACGLLSKRDRVTSVLYIPEFFASRNIGGIKKYPGPRNKIKTGSRLGKPDDTKRVCGRLREMVIGYCRHRHRGRLPQPDGGKPDIGKIRFAGFAKNPVAGVKSDNFIRRLGF